MPYDEPLALTVLTRDLMAENQVLRGLLKSLSGFIGEGAGGIVNKVGWELSEFNDLINKAETDTAWESYQRHKRDNSESVPGTAGPSGSSSQKRPADDSDPYGLRPKRARAETNGDSRTNDNFPLLVPLNPAVSSMGPNGLYPPGRSHDGNSLLPDYGRGPSSASPMFVPPSSPSVNNQSGPYGSSMSFQSPYGTGMSMTGDPMSSMTMVNSGMASMGGSSRPQSTTQSTPQQQQDDEEIDPKKMDAYKLVQYVHFIIITLYAFSSYDGATPLITTVTILTTGSAIITTVYHRRCGRHWFRGVWFDSVNPLILSLPPASQNDSAW